MASSLKKTKKKSRLQKSFHSISKSNNQWSIVAPAKINLFLHITGKRPDNYHELESLMVFTEFGDVLTVEDADELSLNISGDFADAISHEATEDNLVVKAARLLAERYAIQPNIAISLEKNIPVGAGVGGGSADAAAILKLLAELWGIDMSLEELAEIGLQLGADVPPCIYSKPVMVRGIGEDITPIANVPSWHVVLVNPREHVSTPEIFKTREAVYREKLPADFVPSLAGLKQTHNDLEVTAEKLVPEIRIIIDAIAATEGCKLGRMSGSGATCFGLFENEDTAQQAVKKLQQSHPEWWIISSLLNS